MAQQVYSFMIEPDLEDGLKRLKARDGIVEGEQIRLALRDWLDRSGISGKPVRGDERPFPKPFALVSFLVATPLLNLAVLLDYHRRGL
ncbi:MAG: hypothetical protein AB7L71_10170 [Vicinamibacterales bacterium]